LKPKADCCNEAGSSSAASSPIVSGGRLAARCELPAPMSSSRRLADHLHSWLRSQNAVRSTRDGLRCDLTRSGRLGAARWRPSSRIAPSPLRIVTNLRVCSPWCHPHAAGRSSTGTRHCCARSAHSTLPTLATRTRHNAGSPTRPRHVSARSLSSTNSTVRLARSVTSSGEVRARGCGRACVLIDRAWNLTSPLLLRGTCDSRAAKERRAAARRGPPYARVAADDRSLRSRRAARRTAARSCGEAAELHRRRTRRGSGGAGVVAAHRRFESGDRRLRHRAGGHPRRRLELRALAEVYASDDAREKVVHDLHGVGQSMNLDRFDVG
jgi:hypothetical protein